MVLFLWLCRRRKRYAILTLIVGLWLMLIWLNFLAVDTEVNEVTTSSGPPPPILVRPRTGFQKKGSLLSLFEGHSAPLWHCLGVSDTFGISKEVTGAFAVDSVSAHQQRREEKLNALLAQGFVRENVSVSQWEEVERRKAKTTFAPLGNVCTPSPRGIVSVTQLSQDKTELVVTTLNPPVPHSQCTINEGELFTPDLTDEERIARLTSYKAAVIDGDTQHFELQGATGTQHGDKDRFAPIAYLLILSNEEFIDGALVLGASLRQTSQYLQSHLADLVAITTQGRVGSDSKKRLLTEGEYDHVFDVPSLAFFSPGRRYSDTFDKIYMFGLYMYEKVVFLDADMIAIWSMDSLFSTPQLGRPNVVGAVGFNAKGGPQESGAVPKETTSKRESYFQTGMMTLIPSHVVFEELFNALFLGTPPRSQRFVGGNARDGMLIRSVLKSNFYSISKRFSRNLNPRLSLLSEGLLAIHLRGMFKPWFNRRRPMSNSRGEKRDYGFTYVTWWQLYEEFIHKRSEYYLLAQQGKPAVTAEGPFGGMLAGGDELISPLTHVWLQRHSPNEYVQLLAEEDVRRRNGTLPGLQFIAGSVFGQSCDDVCSLTGMQCSEEALHFSSLQDCSVLRAAFGCAHCELGVFWQPHPGNDYPALERITQKDGASEPRLLHHEICKYNLDHDIRTAPNCSAYAENTRRYCPCVPK